MALTTFTGGVNTNFSTELNGNFNSFKIQQIYTGSDFDVSVSGANQDTSASHELTAITSTNLAGADYLSISILATSDTKTFTDFTALTKLKLEIKEVGGSYSTIYDNIFAGTDQNTGTGDQIILTNRIEWVHTLTSGEKTNGIQVKITGTAQTGNDGGNEASITNQQVVLRLGA